MKSDQRETISAGIYMDQKMMVLCELMIHQDDPELGICRKSLLQPIWLIHLDIGNPWAYISHKSVLNGVTTAFSVEVPALLCLAFPVKSWVTESLCGISLSVVRYHQNQWLHLQLWVHTATQARILQHSSSQALSPAVLSKADSSRAVALFCRTLCFLPVPPNSIQTPPIIFRLLIQTEGTQFLL